MSLCRPCQPCPARLLVQKKTLTARERDETKREAFLQELENVPAAKLFFFDEAGCNRSMTRLYGWARREVRCYDRVRGNRGKNQSILGVCYGSGMLCWQVVSGAVQAYTVEAFVKDAVLPCLTQGDVLVLDNAAIHRKKPLVSLCAASGVRLLFLPPYSPDFSPIELAWKVVKGRLRAEEHREYGTLLCGIEQALQSVTAKQMQNFYKHCGYLTDEPL